MIVYILLQGETCEGGNTLGVFSSSDKAKEYAEEREHHCPWGDWDEDTYDGMTHIHRLDAGCEWQSIEEWEVTE